MKIKHILVLFSIMFLFVSGCTPAPDPVKETLVVGMGGDAVSLDPHATNDQPSSRVGRQIYETLIVQTEDLELVPGVATSWRQIDDLTFEFTLKKGVKFHNGEELKASDVKFTIERALKSTFIGHIVGQIEAVTVVSEIGRASCRERV